MLGKRENGSREISPRSISDVYKRLFVFQALIFCIPVIRSFGRLPERVLWEYVMRAVERPTVATCALRIRRKGPASFGLKKGRSWILFYAQLAKL